VIKDKYPNLTIEEQYIKALETRPGYTVERISSIIQGAKRACSESGIKFNFQIVVIQMTAMEYTQRTGLSPYPIMNDINKAILSAVPEKL